MKEKKIAFTNDQYKTLVKLLFYGDWILSASKIEQDELSKEAETLTNYVFSKKANFALKDWFDDVKFGEQLTEEVTMDLLEKVFEYNEDTFWFDLIKKLALRDATNEQLNKGGSTFDHNAIENLQFKYEDKYEKAFENREIDQLFLIEKNSKPLASMEEVEQHEMHHKIQHYLAEIEEEKDIEILWACETGSRAWGFPSTDSDYDIRIIYVHKNDWYLSITQRKDNIEKMLDNNNIDITGWELKKTLNLLRKSNASVLERIQSPIVYQSDEAFIKDIRSLSELYYSKIATMHHYLSMAKKFMDELQMGNTYSLKKFFYALRSALVCKWIIEKNTIPPIEFSKIYKHLAIEVSLTGRIEELIELKSTKTESYKHKGEKPLIELIQSCIEKAEVVKNTLPASKGNLDDLNGLFGKYVMKYDY